MLYMRAHIHRNSEYKLACNNKHYLCTVSDEINETWNNFVRFLNKKINAELSRKCFTKHQISTFLHISL